MQTYAYKHIHIQRHLYTHSGMYAHMHISTHTYPHMHTHLMYSLVIVYRVKSILVNHNLSHDLRLSYYILPPLPSIPPSLSSSSLGTYTHISMNMGICLYLFLSQMQIILKRTLACSRQR